MKELQRLKCSQVLGLGEVAKKDKLSPKGNFQAAIT